jgi:hypothetical protein
MKHPLCALSALALLCFFAGRSPAQDHPPDASPAPSPPANSQPGKAPKPKSRLNLLKQMQVDFDMALPRAQVDGKDQKKLNKCHEVFIDAIAQQQRYKSVNAGKVNGCLKDLDRLLDAGAFPGPDRDKLLQDSERLGESVGKPKRIRLPQPL